MKSILFAVVAAFSINAMAIEFITEEQVANTIGATKAIEVSKYAVQSLISAGSNCASAFASRSARAYVVKLGNQAYLYLTESGLKDLQVCTKL